MKKLLSLCMSFLVLCCFCTNLHGQALNFTPNFEIRSQAALLMSLDTDTILYQKNAENQYMPGSLVQIMTAVVVLENCQDLRTNITADSSLYTQFTTTEYPDDLRYADIKDGNVLSVEELLHAMLLTSSAEAAILLANHFGNGSVPNFVQMMNDKAKALGCTQTNFTNPTGIYNAAQKTTAADLAIITKYALSLGRFEDIATASTFSTYTPNESPSTGWTWAHSNTMIEATSPYYVKGVKGLKTANMTTQGRSIVCEASRDGNSYLIILLAAPFEDSDGDLQYYHQADAANLLNWAFEHFSYQTILSESTELGQIKVENGDGSDYVLVKPEQSFMTLWYDSADMASIVQEVTLDEDVSAPVDAGDKLGEVVLKFSGEQIAAIDLVATSSVELSPFKYYMALIQHFPKTPWLMRAVIISILLCAIYIALCVYAHVCHQQRLKPVQPVHLKPSTSGVKREAARSTDRERRAQSRTHTSQGSGRPANRNPQNRSAQNPNRRPPSKPKQ
ncbi:MAG: D-alanyl-D-alanine carboxypeptidase [Oscillospiraceae bacterium]|nr:D-alanyl-D-alanine carboxypeptidase [Oscillospiraceae bacterium]